MDDDWDNLVCSLVDVGVGRVLITIWKEKVSSMDYRTDEEREEQSRLLSRKDELAGKKREHESELMLLKNEVRGRRLPERRYMQLCEIQATRLKQIREIEHEMREIKSRLRELNDMESKRYHDAEVQKIVEVKVPHITRADVLYLVSEIRDEYRQFSADPTRVSSMRRAAAEFANKLDDLLGRFKLS